MIKLGLSAVSPSVRRETDTEDDVTEAEGYWNALRKGGPFAILFGALLWVFIMDVRADQKATRAEHAEFRAEAVASDQALKNVLGQLLMAQERSVYLQRRLCIILARTQAEREGCARDNDQ